MFYIHIDYRGLGGYLRDLRKIKQNRIQIFFICPTPSLELPFKFLTGKPEKRAFLSGPTKSACPVLGISIILANIFIETYIIGHGWGGGSPVHGWGGSYFHRAHAFQGT